MDPLTQIVQELSRQLDQENEDLRKEVDGLRSDLRKLLQERRTEVVARPKAHRHTTDDNRPVLCFDLDGTLHPGTGLPLDGVEPFPGLKQCMDAFVGEGCCLHLQTGELAVGGPQDMEIYFARHALIESWLGEHGLPVGLLLPKIVADCFYDDRMVPVPENPDYGLIRDVAVTMLSEKFKKDESGQWARKPKKYKGPLISDWPNPKEIPGDSPRGFTGPRLDADLHRTVLNSSSSERMGQPLPGAREALVDLYDSGVTVNLSCAGWNPAFRTPDESARRLAGLRLQLRTASIPYDRLVTKDHGDLFFDDRGVTCTGSWEDDMPLIAKKLGVKNPLKEVAVAGRGK